MKKTKKERKALFSQRIIAYVIDIILVGVLTTLISSFIPTSNNLEKLEKEQTTIMENYVNQKISIDKYMNQMLDLSYDISKETAALSIISVVMALIFFVIYPFYHNGQSIGKQIMKIKVKKIDGELTMNDMLFRSMVNHSIFVNILLLCFLFFTRKSFYITSSNILSFIQYAVFFASVFMIAFSAKKQGLHDKLVHTEVVCVDPIKIEEEENVVCEN